MIQRLLNGFFIFLALLVVININCKNQSRSSNGIQGIMDQIEEWVEGERIVGAEILIIRSREIILHEAFGWRDRERNIPMERNTICRIRSMTKPIVGTAILMLMEQERLSITDKVALYIPSFNNEKSREVTIEQLLTHTGGFEDPGYPGTAVDYGSLKELVDAVGTSGPTYTPGERFLYSDGGSSTLAYIVTVVSGMPVEDFIQTNILGPLGMVDSFCNLTEDDPRRSRVSCTYWQNAGEWVKYWDNHDPQVVPFFRGSGGIYSTTTDYARFLTMWVDEGISGSMRFLTPGTVRQALTPSPQSIEGNFPYGFQWSIYDEPTFGHSGSDGTLAWADPVEDLMIFYFTQSRRNNTTGEIVNIVLEALY
jgi:CubicO group peptidase (beta-lactamase class C family)